MKIKSLNCPECGASIEIDKSRDVCFCSYCGCKIAVDEDKKEINVNINKTTRNIDEMYNQKRKKDMKAKWWNEAVKAHIEAQKDTK